MFFEERRDFLAFTLKIALVLKCLDDFTAIANSKQDEINFIDELLRLKPLKTSKQRNIK